jgi:hypothetical protein
MGGKIKGAGGEAANAQVCKTCTRGFNSRPALQTQDEIQIKLLGEHICRIRPALPGSVFSLDSYAVALALVLALLVRLNLLPPIKW